MHAIILRGFPCFLFLDADRTGSAGRDLVMRLKSDAFTAIVPVVVLSDRHEQSAVESWFAAGADEVITGLFSIPEQRARIAAIQNRTARDVSVHPSTRLPGTTEIEREIKRRLDGGGEFAVCYADLDHFKEFNDRYSYYDGDRVIYIVSRMLRDVVKGVLGDRGFVGHIGGDDFIFIIPGSRRVRDLRRDHRRVRHADPVAVFRTGPPRGIFLRQGPARPAVSGAADDAFDRHRHESSVGRSPIRRRSARLPPR